MLRKRLLVSRLGKKFKMNNEIYHACYITFCNNVSHKIYELREAARYRLCFSNVTWCVKGV